MSASSDLQDAVEELLASGLKSQVPLVKKKDKGPEKSLVTKVQEAATRFGICLHILPPLPTRTLQGNPFVFWAEAELRVRIVEFPQTNIQGPDAFELMDAVALLLHWKNPGNMLAHPMQLAAMPCDMVEDPEKRILDVIFELQFQINAG